MHLRVLNNFERNLKYLFRSGSLDLMLHWAECPSKIRQFALYGHPFYYRSGTSDMNALNEVLFRKGKKAEYYFPLEKEPLVILDIGGHIGASAIYYAQTYPRAKIFSIEPVRQNFELLRKNTAPYPNIQALNFALSSTDGSFLMYEDSDPTNLGGYSLIPDVKAGAPLGAKVQTKSVSGFLRENSLRSVDLIKIDTEGAEFDILTCFPEPALARVKWIIGELHGKRDFELLAYLSKWFHIGINKEKIIFQFSIFRAVNRNLGTIA